MAQLRTKDRKKGIMEIVTEGKTYPFKLSTNALCTIEEMTGKTIMEVSSQMGMRELRLCFWAGIHEFVEDVTIKEIGDMIDEIGWDKANDIFVESLKLTFPDVYRTKTDDGSVDEETEKNLNPQQVEIG